MSQIAILDRSQNVVSLTDLARRGAALFDKVATTPSHRLLVLKQSTPLAVVVNVDEYERLLDEYEYMRSEVEKCRSFYKDSNQ